MSINQLRDEVGQLSKGELSEFSLWFEEFMADQWDKEIERDLLSGRFDQVGEQAIADHKAGLCTPL